MMMLLLCTTFLLTKNILDQTCRKATFNMKDSANQLIESKLYEIYARQLRAINI